MEWGLRMGSPEPFEFNNNLSATQDATAGGMVPTETEPELAAGSYRDVPLGLILS